MILCYGLAHCLVSLQLLHEVEEKILFLYELKLKLTLNLWTVNKFFPEKAGFAEIIKKVSSLTLAFYIHPAGLEEKCAERWAGWQRAQLSPCLPSSLALQAKTVLKVSKVLYLKSLTSKGRTLGEYVSSHYELVSSNKSSWHLLLDVGNKSPDSIEILKKPKQPNPHTLYHHQIYKFKIYSGKIQC